MSGSKTTNVSWQKQTIEQRAETLGFFMVPFDIYSDEQKREFRAQLVEDFTTLGCDWLSHLGSEWNPLHSAAVERMGESLSDYYDAVEAIARLGPETLYKDGGLVPLELLARLMSAHGNVKGAKR